MANDKNFVVKNGLTVDTNTLYVDASTNRVGIGTTTPVVDLHVSGNIKSTAHIDVDLTGTFGTGVFTPILGTTDSSAITIIPPATFSSDVIVENNLYSNNIVSAQYFVGDGSLLTGINTGSGAAYRIVEYPTVTNGSADVTISTAYPIANIDVYLNGAQLKATDDYTVSGTTLTLGTTLETGDVVTVVAYQAATTATLNNLSDTSVSGQATDTLLKFNGSAYVPTDLTEDNGGNLTVAGEINVSTINTSDSSAITITPDVVMNAGLTVGNHILPSSNENIDLGSASFRFRDLYLSGESINLGGVQITKSGSAIALPAGSTIGGVVPGSSGSGSTQTEEHPTVTNGSATVTLSAPRTLSQIEVYLNGIKLRGGTTLGGTTEWTVSDTTLTFDQNLSTGDEVTVVSLVTATAALAEEFPTVTAGSADVTMSQAFTLSQIDVYLNGVRLKATDEYTVSGSTLTLGENLVSGDIVAVVPRIEATDATLASLSDTNVAGVSDGELLKFDNSTSKYVPTSMVEDSSGNVGIGSNLDYNTKLYIKDDSSSDGRTGLKIDRNITDISDGSQYGVYLATDVNGSSTSDGITKTSYGIYNKVTNYANGFNTTTDRNNHYGMYTYSISDSSSAVRDSFAILGRSDQYSTSTINNFGIYGQAYSFNGTNLSNQSGFYGLSDAREGSSVTNSRGIFAESQVHSSGGAITNSYGGYFYVDLNTPDTVTYPGATSTVGTAYGVRAYINNRTGAQITGPTYMFRGQAAGSGTYTGTKYGVYVNGEDQNRGDVGWTTGSDIRIKENIENITDAVDKVKQIRGVIYNRIGKDRREAGVIAQELEEVLPEAVVDFDPDPDDDDDRIIKGVTYDRITALLIEAIKEQQTTIEALETRLTALEGGA